MSRGLIVVVTALHAGIEVQVEVLKAERGEEDESGEDFAGTSGGEPTLDPDKDHADEEDVGKREGCEQKRRPKRQRRFRDDYADVGCDKGESADDIGRAEQAEEEPRGEVAREAEREADDGVDVEAEAGGRDVEDDEHPEREDAPGEDGQHR